MTGPQAVWSLIVWVINGVLALLYFSLDHLITIALAVAAGWFALAAPSEQRPWALASAALSVLASLLAPPPVPVFLLAISLGGWAGLALEQYNRPAQRWNVIRAQALYALAGSGFALYRSLGLGEAIAADPSMAQGAGYLNALLGIAMYVLPIGFLALLAQSVWAHPPAPGTPEELIRKVRTRQ